MRAFLTLLTCLLYAILFWQLQGLPFQDLPNHLSRSFLIGQLLFQSSAPSYFHFEWMFCPYLLGDLVLAFLLQWTPLEVAGKIWILACLFFPVVSLYVYLRAKAVDSIGRSIVLLCSLYLFTNWFWLSAYTNYCLGIGGLFLTLSAWETCQSPHGKRLVQLCSSVGFVVGLIACYLMHLSAFLFCSVIIFSQTCWRWATKQLSFGQAMIRLIPSGVLGGTHLANQVSGPSEVVVWRTAWDKVCALGVAFLRFDYPLDFAFFFAFSVLVVYIRFQHSTELPSQQRQVFINNNRRELLVILFFLFLTYCALPREVGTAQDIDIRVVPLLFVFAILLVLPQVSMSVIAARISIGVSLVLAIGNVLYLYAELKPHSDFLVSYHAALKQIPTHQTLLPISTRPDDGRIQTSLHAGTLYNAIGQGVTPYIFSKNVSGKQIAYFSYQHDLYTPYQFWYLRNMEVDWSAVADTYDYLLLTKPFDISRLGGLKYKEVFSNKAVTILRRE